MSKKRHNLESKLMIVKYVLDEKHSFWEASDFFGVAYQTIRTWVKHYEHEGISGLTIKNKGDSGEFRVYVIEYMRKHKLSLAQTAIQFSLPDHTRIRIWNKIYDEKGPQYLMEEHRGRKKMKNTEKSKFKVNNEKLYLSPIVDLYNGEVISYNLAKHPTFQQVVDMLNKAFKKVSDYSNLIIHSD